MAHALETTFSVPLWVTGLAAMLLTGLVILGGIRRIGMVAAAWYRSCAWPMCWPRWWC